MHRKIEGNENQFAPKQEKNDKEKLVDNSLTPRAPARKLSKKRTFKVSLPDRTN